MRPEIDLEAFVAAQADGAYVLDVREPGEYVAGHIPGAHFLPLFQVLSQASQLPQDQTIYVICASGNRSKTATDWLQSRGLKAVSVAGGINGWIHQGHPIVQGTQPHAS